MMAYITADAMEHAQFEKQNPVLRQAVWLGMTTIQDGYMIITTKNPEVHVRSCISLAELLSASERHDRKWTSGIFVVMIMRCSPFFLNYVSKTLNFQQHMIRLCATARSKNLLSSLRNL